jgi:hypothetical protein
VGNNLPTGRGMQEFAWLRLNRFRDMAEFVADRSSDRKLRLVACGCVRRVPQLLEDPRLLAAFQLAEAFADYRANKQQLKAARPAVRAVVDELREKAIAALPAEPLFPFGSWSEAVFLRVFGAGGYAAQQREYAELRRRHRAEEELPVRAANIVSRVLETWKFTPVILSDLVSNLRPFILLPDAFSHQVYWYVDTMMCDVLRDVVGNPFRPVAFAADWRSVTAVSLARVMYETGDFSPMPILADALQDTGCEDADVLNHCRGDTPHVRGCWVVDRVLGKA